MFNLSLFTTVAPLQTAISSFNYSRGATNIAAALAYVRRMMLTPLAGARHGVPKVVIVLTDGKSSDPAATQVHGTALADNAQLHCVPKNCTLLIFAITFLKQDVFQ